MKEKCLVWDPSWPLEPPLGLNPNCFNILFFSTFLLFLLPDSLSPFLLVLPGISSQHNYPHPGLTSKSSSGEFKRLESLWQKEAKKQCFLPIAKHPQGTLTALWLICLLPADVSRSLLPLRNHPSCSRVHLFVKCQAWTSLFFSTWSFHGIPGTHRALACGSLAAGFGVSIFQSLCQLSLPFVFQNWLELLTRIPKGGQKLQITMVVHTPLAAADKSQQHKRGLTSRHQKFSFRQLTTRGGGQQGRKHTQVAKMQMSSAPSAFV